MHTVKKYAFYVQLLCFVLLVNSSHENTAKNPAFFASKVNISDNFVVEWRVNDTAKNVEFKVNVTIDEKGWVLLGFMPTPKNKSSDKNHPMKLSDTRGDFLITWPSSSSERTTLDLNTISHPGEIKEDENSTKVDYHVRELIASTNTSRRSVLLIRRKLDTGDPQDVPITDKPMWIFGAYGNSEDYFKDLSAIASDIDDNLAVKEVIFVQKRNKEEDSIKPWHKVLKEQMEKHWIGVVLAVSGALTVVITATVYCCFRKRDEFKSKKLKMTFYREDEDDEARVAFLHSRT